MKARLTSLGPHVRRHSLRAFRYVFGFCAVSGVLTALALGAAVLWFWRGPIEMADAARAAETVLTETIGPGSQATVAVARLDWSLGHGLAVELGDIAVKDGTGALTATIPRARIRLYTLPLLIGSVKPSGFEIEAPKLSVDLPRLGAALPSEPTAAAVPAAPALGGGASPAPGGASATAGTPAPAAGATMPPEAVATVEGFAKAIKRGVEAGRREGLNAVTVTDGHVEIARLDPLGRPRLVVIPGIEISGLIDGPGGAFDMGFSARGEVGRWTMRLRELRRTDRKGNDFVFEAADVTHHDLFGQGDPAFDPRMPGYPTLKVGLDGDDALDEIRLDSRLGTGIFRFGHEPEDEVLLDEATIRGAWLKGDRTFRIERATATIGETRLAFQGEATPGARPGDPWAVAFDVLPSQAGPRDVPDQPLKITGGHFAGQWDGTRKVLDLGTGEIQYTGGAVGIVARVDLSGDQPRFLANFAFSPLDVFQIRHLWPHFTAPEARTWFLDRTTQGRLSDLVIKLDIPLGQPPSTWTGKAVDLRARIEQIVTGSFGNLPPVTGGDGRVVLADKRLDITADHAQIATKASKRPSIDQLRFTVPDVFQKPAKGQIRLQASGDAAALAEVVNAEPLAVLDEAGIKAEALAGSATVTAAVDMVFEPEMTPASITYKVDASLDRFSSAAPIGGRRIQDGKLRIVADQVGTAITGKASIDGVPADLNLYQPRDGAKGGDRRDLKMVLDDAARARMGLDIADLLSGPATLSISQTSDTTRRIEADLTQARLTLNQFGWAKGPGVPAKATMDLVGDDKGTRIDNLSVEAEGMAIKGSAVVDASKRLASIDITKLQLRKGDDARIKLVRAPDQSMNVSFDAGSFDIRSLIAASKQAGSGADDDPKARSADLNIKARVAKLIGFNDVTLADVVIDAQVKGSAMQRLQLTGRVPGGRSIEIAIRPDGQGRVFGLSTDDAGSVLSFLDVFDRIRAGSLLVKAVLPAVGAADGQVWLNDFRLLEQPKSARGKSVERLADGSEAIYVRRAPIPSGTDFDRASVKFTLRRGAVTVTDGIIKGQQTGATASGQLDLNNGRAALTGTYIPLYGLNNLVGRIPILGEIAGAGRNEGLVGVTFRIVGPLDDPILQVNPISAIAPGIFRRIFEFNPERGRPAADAADPAGRNGPTRLAPN